MNYSKTNPINLIGIKAETKPDGCATLVVRTKYAGETVYSLPAELVQGLLSDLQEQRRSVPPVSAASENRAAPSPSAGNATASVEVRAPKRFAVGTALPQHPMVVLLIDPQTDQQAGFALRPQAAREMATALVRQSDVVSSQTDPKSASN